MKKLTIAIMCAAMATCAPAHADYVDMDEVQILRQMCLSKMRLARIVMDMKQEGLNLEQQFETIAEMEDGDIRDYVSAKDRGIDFLDSTILMTYYSDRGLWWPIQ